MLISAITIFLLIHFGAFSSAVSGPLDQTEAHIKQYVGDDARRKQALAIVDQMKAESKAYSQKIEKSVDVLNKLTTKRTTPMSEIEHAGQPLISEDRANAERLLDLRFQLKSVLTADEWVKVFPVTAKPKPTKTAAGFDIDFPLQGRRGWPLSGIFLMSS